MIRGTCALKGVFSLDDCATTMTMTTNNFCLIIIFCKVYTSIVRVFVQQIKNWG